MPVGAPVGNTNRRGKTNNSYNLIIPRLKCGTCLAKDNCPVVGKPEQVCVFLQNIRNRRKDLDTLEGIRATRRRFLLETLVQMEVMSLSQEAGGVSSKEMISYRKILMEQFAQLEKDEFEQQQKTKKTDDKQNFLGSLIKELAKPALPEPREIINAEFKVLEDATR